MAEDSKNCFGDLFSHLLEHKYYIEVEEYCQQKDYHRGSVRYIDGLQEYIRICYGKLPSLEWVINKK